MNALTGKTTTQLWFNWELCGKSIEPLFSKAPLVEMLLTAPLRPYSIIIFSEKIRAIYLVYQGYLVSVYKVGQNIIVT
jgi:hypothetical protein